MENCMFDVLIIGAGIAGLISAKNLAEKGLKVKVIEASSHSGGQIVNSYDLNRNVSLELGAGWLCEKVHCDTLSEMRKYDIIWDGESVRKTHFITKNSILTTDEIKRSEQYSKIIKLINKDVSYVKKGYGFNQSELADLDIPFIDYLNDRLKAEGTVKEYLLIQSFILTGAKPDLLSALSFIYLIASFGTAEFCFSSKQWTRSDKCFSKLVQSLTRDILRLGGEIEYDNPVIEVSLETSPIVPKKIINYDFDETNYPFTSTIVKVSTGTYITSRMIISTIPLNCLNFIKFSPSLPRSMSLAAERCNGGRDYTKIYAFCHKISNRIERLLSWNGICKDSYVVSRSYNNNGISENDDDSDLGHSESDKCNIIVLNGWRDEILYNIEEAARALHPEIELVSNDFFINFSQISFDESKTVHSDGNDTVQEDKKNESKIAGPRSVRWSDVKLEEINHVRTQINIDESEEKSETSISESVAEALETSEESSSAVEESLESSVESSAENSSIVENEVNTLDDKSLSSGSESNSGSSSDSSAKDDKSYDQKSYSTASEATGSKNTVDKMTEENTRRNSLVKLSIPKEVLDLQNDDQTKTTSFSLVEEESLMESSSVERDTSLSICFHDFVVDRFIHSSKFALRAGTAELHHEACLASQQPLKIPSNYTLLKQLDKENNGETSYSSLFLSRFPDIEVNYQQNNYRKFLDKFENNQEKKKKEEILSEEVNSSAFIICNSELQNEFAGWVEGAIRAGYQASKTAIDFLSTRKITRNMQKRKIHNFNHFS